MPRDLIKGEVSSELKQDPGDVWGEVVVEGLLGDIYDGVPCQDDLEGTALSLIAQHHQQNAYLSDVFSKQNIFY